MPVKVQSYTGDKNDNYSLPHKHKYVYYEIYGIYGWHAKASEAAINLEKRQIVRCGEQNISIWWIQLEN